MTTTPSTDAAASRFARGAMLGRGANAVVYRAFDRELAREVALKAFDDRAGEALLRLKSEFRTLRGVAHPNLVQLYELVVSRDEAFFTMELLDGASDVVRYVRADQPDGHPLDARGHARLRTSFAQIFDGLTALHAARLLHRDLKPSNVLVAPGGRTVLLDFGLVAGSSTGSLGSPGELVSESARESAGEFVGTPAYAAPELLWGHRASEASDAYSAGVLLAQCLTGLAPAASFSADARLRLQRLIGDVADGDVPDDLLAISRGLLTPEVDERWSPSRARAALSTGPSTASASTRIDARTSTPFVGRQTEKAWLAARLQEAERGQMGVAVVRGESGIGKTELVRRFLTGAPCGLVLCGSCRPRESVPYNALDGMADALSVYLLDGEPAADIAGDAIDALLRVFPVLEQVPSLVARRVADPTAAPREIARKAVAAMAGLLRARASAGPIVLWVDDAQWGDADSAFALRELLDRGVPRLLVVLTCRSDVDGGIAPALEGGPARIDTLALGPLAPAESRELAGLLVERDEGAQSLLDTIVQQSSGSPYVLQELSSQATARQGDVTAVDLAARTVARFESVDPNARAIAQVIALGGSAIRLAEVLEIGGCPASDAVVYRMQELRLLRAAGSRSAGLEIYHDRIRDALLGTLTAEGRRRLHRLIATTVRRRPVPDAATLVEHYLGCDERGEASEWAVVAAGDAERGLAFARAAELYRLALELRDRGDDDWDLAGRLGRATAFAGERVRGGQVLDDAASSAERHGAGRTELIRLRADAARELLCGGDVDGGLDALGRMVKTAGFRYPATPQRALVALLGLRAALALRGLGFRERSEQEVGPERLERLDACWTGIIGLNSFDAVRSGAFQARHTLLALSAGEPKRVTRALVLEAAYRAVEGGDRGRRQAWRLLARVDELAGRLDDAQTTAFAHLCASVAHYFAGQWTPAFERASAGERVFSQVHGSGWERTMCRMYRLWSAAWSGDTAMLRREQSDALEAARASDDWLAGIIAASGHANLPWLLDDDPGEARRRAVEVIGRFPEIGFQSPHYADLVARTRIDLYEGSPWQAWDRIESAWPRLRAAQLLRLQLFRIELRHLRALAALAVARSTEDAPDHLRGWSRERLLGVARRQARRLHGEDLALAGAMAATIDAGLAASAEDARRALDRAAREFASAGARLHAAILRALAGSAATGANKQTGDLQSVGDQLAIADPMRLARIVAPSPALPS